MGSKPTCPPGCWCEPRPRKVGQGRAPPCRSHRTVIRGKGSRTCWQPCSRARRSQGECTRTRVRSPWCCQEWRWGSKAHPSIPAPTHGRCPCGSSPRNQGSQGCHQHLLQAEHHRHHLTQEARSTRDSSPMPPRLGCQRWSPRQSSWAVGALGINPICSKRIIKRSFSSPINHQRRGIAPSTARCRIVSQHPKDKGTTSSPLEGEKSIYISHLSGIFRLRTRWGSQTVHGSLEKTHKVETFRKIAQPFV